MTRRAFTRKPTRASPIPRPVCPGGGLRCYPNPRTAREAMRSAGNRVRVYRCKACGWHHVTKQAKGDG